MPKFTNPETLQLYDAVLGAPDLDERKVELDKLINHILDNMTIEQAERAAGQFPYEDEK